MPKYSTILLLLPCALLLIIACLAFSLAGALSFAPSIEQRRHEDFAKFAAKVQAGEVQPTKEQWVTLLRNSRDVEEAMVTGHARISRALGYCMLLGAAAHLYVVIRIRSASRKAGG